MDFKRFYEEQSDYKSFRDDPLKQQEYRTKTDWKARQLVCLLPEVNEVQNILEVGCAMGILLNNISTRLSVKDYYGLDISEQNIEKARALFPEGHFHQGVIEDFIPLMQEEFLIQDFDIVILSDIIEHIPDDLGFMKGVRMISKRVLVNLPLEKSWKNRKRKYGENDHSGHLRSYNEKDAFRLFKNAGYEILRSFTVNPLTDKQYFSYHEKARAERIRKKALPKKIFWSLYYPLEDRLKFMNKSIYERIYGTNLFALLKPVN